MFMVLLKPICGPIKNMTLPLANNKAFAGSFRPRSGPPPTVEKFLPKKNSVKCKGKNHVNATSVTKAKICFISSNVDRYINTVSTHSKVGQLCGMNGNPTVVIELVVQSSYATCILAGLLCILSMYMYYMNLKVKFRLYTPRRQLTQSVNQCSK